MRAFCMIRPQPVYRREAFVAGLEANGYQVFGVAPRSIEPDDLLLIWNRYWEMHELACKFEGAGATVIVAENGYCGPGGVSPHDMEPREWYALALDGHNGSGRWPVGDESRWNALGVDLKPWRTEREHILVAPNRSFGRPGYIMPTNWADDVATRLRALTKREVRIRQHPGNGKPTKPLAEDLRDAWATVIWSSSVGVQSLIAGVPVICEAPAWIGMPADELGGVGMAEHADGSDFNRQSAMHSLAWAQWHVDEIATGEPFARLMEFASKRDSVAA